MNCETFSSLSTVDCNKDFNILWEQWWVYVKIPKSCITWLSSNWCVVDPDLIPSNIAAWVSITSCWTTVVWTLSCWWCTIPSNLIPSNIASWVTINICWTNIVGTHTSTACTLVASPAQILSWATVSAWGTTVTWTHICPSVWARFFSQPTSPTAAVNWDYWNDTSTTTFVKSYIRSSWSWVHTWYGNIDTQLIAPNVKLGVDIYGIIWTN